ncbi:AMP-binding protein, partial [Marichromatium gracile]|uniref:AMP-binding protein n=1 Tax=Marichromatium gracile TaxID=1048 RepID=UPI000B33D7DA
MSTCAAIAPETVREQVCALLPLPAAEVAAEDNLIALGLDSLHVMRLVSQWRRAGAEIGFAELIERPTLAAWQGLLGAAPAPTAPTPTAPRHDPAAPFALTDVQHAYWIGRQDGQPLGGVGCHAYLELDGDALDPARLDAAWRALLAHHPMLRARFDDQGRQRIAAQSGCAPLTVHDLRTLDPASRARRLETIREALSHRRLAVERGEVAGLALSLLPEGRGRVHLDLDLLVADVESLRILLRDLARLYAADAPPAAPAGWSFADYLAAVETRAAPRLEADRDYWRARAATLPAGPQLPLRQAPETIDRPRFRRRRHWLDVADWRRLGERAQARGLTPALVLATAYAEVLARWSAAPRLSLNLPLFDRHDDLPGAAEAVADFTSLLLLEVDCATPRDFAARAATVQRQFHADMAHAGYCGVRVQRDLAHLRGGDGFAAPVVFACNLGAPLLDDDTRATLGAFDYMISQTPQVWLDHQVYEQDGALLLAWDAVEALFPEGMIDAMFAAYTELLTRLARSERAWSEPAMLPLPEAQRRVRSEVNATALALAPRLLHAGLFATAHREPGRPALVDGEQVIGHGELADAALRIAGWLHAAGLAPGEAVAVSLPRGATQVAAVFGVLAAGGCYVPIGVEQPSARRARILERAGVGLVLDAEMIAQARAHAPLPAPVAVAPSSPAYVIFTSGSTGEPKGVE